MVDIAAAISTAQAIVEALIKASPAIIETATKAKPYVEAIAGLISGGNATQEQLDQVVADVTALSAEFQKPLPPDDGNTTT